MLVLVYPCDRLIFIGTANLAALLRIFLFVFVFPLVFDKDGVSILLGSCARQGGETPGSDLSDGRQAEKLYFTLLCCYDLFFVSIVFLLLSLLYFI